MGIGTLHFRQAIEACKQGGVIAYPTESVFGLGCLPQIEQAILRILQLKQRSIEKGLICVAARVQQLENYVDIDLLPEPDIVLKTWPGPVTWLIPAKKETPIWLTGKHDTLAVRVSADPKVRALCLSLGPLVSTSANPQKARPAYTTQQVRTYFGGKIDYLIPANLDPSRKPTEIRDGMTGKIVRIS